MSSDAKSAVFVSSVEMPAGSRVVSGPDFSQILHDSPKGQFSADSLIEKLLESTLSCATGVGYQATNMGKAIEEIQSMLKWENLEPENDVEDDFDGIVMTKEVREYQESLRRRKEEAKRCKIFLGFTANLALSGLRDVFRFLTENQLVQVIVTSGGGIEADWVQCFGQVVHASPTHDPSEYKRYGNVDVPQHAFQKLEEFLTPILDDMLDQQINQNVSWTPSTFIKRVGAALDDPRAITYWTARGNVRVYCPSITDGFLGSVLYRHAKRQRESGGQNNREALRIDLVEDIQNVNNEATSAKCTGTIILGGGMIKHHICNANLMRNGADYVVFINTGQEYDGSDAGARPDEAKSWGKIKLTAKPVKVYSDAAIVFPLIAHQTFVRHFRERR